MLALFKYPNSKVWWYDFRFAGSRQRASTKTRSKTLAIEIERAQRRKLEEGFSGVSKRQAPKLFAAAANDYLVQKKGRSPRTNIIDQYSIGFLSTQFGRTLLNDFTAEKIYVYQQKRLQEGVAPRSVNREVGCLRAILRRNGQWAHLQADVHMLQVDEEFGEVLTTDQEEHLLKACASSHSLSLYPAVVLALCTGMRNFEIRLTRWEAIDLSSGLIIVRRSKTRYGRNRRIPLNERALVALRSWADQWPNRQPTDYVFPAERYGASGHRFQKWVRYAINVNKPIRSWNRSWSTAKKEAGLKIRFHDIRHTVITRMLEGGVPFAVVSSLMGWSPSNAMLMLKKYGHIGQKAFTDAVALVNGPDKKAPSKKRSKSKKAAA
jgi:integrase